MGDLRLRSQVLGDETVTETLDLLTPSPMLVPYLNGTWTHLLWYKDHLCLLWKMPMLHTS